MDEGVEVAVELHIHETEYVVRVKSQKSQIEVELEDRHSGDYWRNTFSQHYIEEITQKTGNYKRFQVFCKMLVDGLHKKTESLLVDILTMQDLQNMKTRHQGTVTPNGTSSNQKRYLILSYLVEYDKVHYPLPLVLDENPDVEALKKTIRRLRMENDELREKGSRRSNSMGISQNNFLGTGVTTSQSGNSQMVLNSEAYKELLRQNQKLKAEMESLQTQQHGALDYDNQQKDSAEMLRVFQQTKEKHMREISRLQSELEMREGLAGGEQEVSALVKTVSRQKKTIDQLEMDLRDAGQTMKKQAQQIKLLQEDLQMALKNKRVNSVTDRLYQPQSKNQTPSVISKASGMSRPSYQRGQQQKVISTQSRGTSKDSRANSVKQWDRKAPSRKPLYPSPSPGAKQQQARREQVAKNLQDNNNRQQKVLSTNRNKYSPAHSVGSNKKSSYSYSSYNSHKPIANRVKTTIDNRKKDPSIFRKQSPGQPDFIARNKQLFGTSQNSKQSRNAGSLKSRSPMATKQSPGQRGAQRPSPVTRPSPVQRPSPGARKNSPYINSANLNSNKYNDNHMRKPANPLSNHRNKDENLLQKLEDLKNRNSSNSKGDSKNIEDRLSKLQELLRMAKQ